MLLKMSFLKSVIAKKKVHSFTHEFEKFSIIGPSFLAKEISMFAALLSLSVNVTCLPDFFFFFCLLLFKKDL